MVFLELIVESKMVIIMILITVRILVMVVLVITSHDFLLMT